MWKQTASTNPQLCGAKKTKRKSFRWLEATAQAEATPMRYRASGAADLGTDTSDHTKAATLGTTKLTTPMG